MTIREYLKAETSNVEYKEVVEVNKPRSWLKTVSAFANTKGGTILFGVRDEDHKIVGLKDIQKLSEKVSELINARINPLPRYEVNTFIEKGKDILELKIGEGPLTPYYYVYDGRSEAFVRTGSESILAPEHVLNNLILKGKNLTYDMVTSKSKISDYSFTLFAATLKEKTKMIFDNKKDFVSLSLADDKEHLNNAGLLLSDQNPIMQSKIVCTRWKGLTKGIVSKDAIDDKEYSGSIISLLENADAFIRNNSKKSWKIVGMDRVELEDYPEIARREAIVNAIIHRDYQIFGSEIHIDMFDDRMEITSPGGMIDGTIIQNLNIRNIPSMRRNIIISDIFSRLHYMERRGSGLSRIMESYNDINEKPKFISDSLSFTVIFPNKSYVLENKTSDDHRNYVSDDDIFLLNLTKSSLDMDTPFVSFKQAKLLFDNYGYDEKFTRESVEKILDLKRSRAGDILIRLLDLELIRKEGVYYQFVKK